MNPKGAALYSGKMAPSHPAGTGTVHSRPLRMPFIPLWRETGQKWQASPMVTLQMNPEGVGGALGIVGGASGNMGGA